MVYLEWRGLRNWRLGREPDNLGDKIFDGFLGDFWGGNYSFFFLTWVILGGGVSLKGFLLLFFMFLLMIRDGDRWRCVFVFFSNRFLKIKTTCFILLLIS